MGKRGLKQGQTPEWKKNESARLAKSIDNRIEYLAKLKQYYLTNKNLPSDVFIPKPTLNGLCEWENKSLKIFSIGSHNTLKKDKEKFKTLKLLAEQINDLYSNLSTPKSSLKKRKRKETIIYWKTRYKKELDKVQILRDELISLRTLYLDLLREIDSDNQLNKRKQESIRRHRKIFGKLQLAEEACKKEDK